MIDQNYVVIRAVCLPADAVLAAANRSELVNGHIVFATDELLDRGEDWTQRLRAVTDPDEDRSALGKPQRIELEGGGWEIAAVDNAGNIIEITTFDANGDVVLRAYGTPPEGGFVRSDDGTPRISEADRVRVAYMSTANLAAAMQRAESGDADAQQCLHNREAWIAAQPFVWNPGDIQIIPPEGEQS